ncbi:tryptophan--tRNA ligase [Amycolatopsis cihanbeyliensis]|uniref:Tryptophan--tRNA ligase n=1 Tax=Amycolatopsis cihanbeyliensis TaxID=1128664 RepID=A0A542DHQ5_AMYCI|nr:tryptophan--tRNA ligase [Amycolatopsis cihanbeyliensis]TQJ02580.1 tryptophanyl-tRNA synthetase [Amycolatopsis cihanbeyliensis]
MTRLSGITPSGRVQLGNYLGAIQRWASQGTAEDLYFVSDLHAMTTTHNPAMLRALTGEQLAVLIAAGISAESVFVQSDLTRELGALSWVLECTCTFGEAARMVQFKEKAKGRDGARLSLLTYPVLMAADILLQGADEIPVGEDQRQHVELARTLAKRFNATYGEVFTVPSAVLPPAGARVRDLADPTRKMSKSTRSTSDTAGVVFVLDEPELVRRKIRRAATDGEPSVAYDPARPGPANLLEILAACTGSTPGEVAEGYGSYGALKEGVAEAVVEMLRPIRLRAGELLDDPAELERVRKAGAARAAERGEHRLRSALRLVGTGH